jgi:hypothetical protein
MTEPAPRMVVLARHPGAETVWIVGGGSSQGFKHGPVMDEMVADAVMGLKVPPAEMVLDACSRSVRAEFNIARDLQTYRILPLC